MAEEVPNDFHRRSVVKKVLGSGMTQGMWTPSTGYHPYFAKRSETNLVRFFLPRGLIGAHAVRKRHRPCLVGRASRM